MVTAMLDDVDGRVEHEWLDPVEEALVCAWLLGLGVEPKNTPVDAEIEYDPVHNEWRIEQFRMGADGGPVVRGDEIVRYIRRVRHRGIALPWPTWAQKIDDLWDRVTDPDP